jgi:hypothetical protein
MHAAMARYLAALATISDRTNSIVLYIAFWLLLGGGVYLPSGVTCTALAIHACLSPPCAH